MVKKGHDREHGDRERNERKEKFDAVTNGRDQKRGFIRTVTKVSGVIFMETTTI